MINLRMEEKLENGEAIDLSKCETEAHYYVIPEEMWDDSGKDYCDAVRECWIWSIGRRYRDGKILASVTTVFYENPDYKCLWLR